MVINSIAVTGTNAADFSQSSSCGSSLAAGANCTVSVTLTASQLGPRSASITITDNTVGSPHSVSLSGVGLTSSPDATWSATSLNFANQSVGTTSPAQSLTLSNYGTTTLSITGIAVTADFGETNVQRFEPRICGELYCQCDFHTQRFWQPERHSFGYRQRPRQPADGSAHRDWCYFHLHSSIWGRLFWSQATHIVALPLSPIIRSAVTRLALGHAWKIRYIPDAQKHCGD